MQISKSDKTLGKVIKLIRTHTFSMDEKLSFAFKYKPYKEILNNAVDEFIRMGIIEDNHYQIYEHHRFSKPETSYPIKLIIPKTLLNRDIESTAHFFIIKRFPVLAYYSSTTTLWRSSAFIKVRFSWISLEHFKGN
jgi:hypothetical protein